MNTLDATEDLISSLLLNPTPFNVSACYRIIRSLEGILHRDDLSRLRKKTGDTWKEATKRNPSLADIPAQ